ncbi:hypothetical protein B484DRAFT_447564 [Ochromonadaceae sp. CCMP2298]|nr:hypothetical protein B484DRAFT_447564 [Ochromonadaceae sp. CCMP2298]|mmetsp:Transcript_812/g.1815  ORF Transcript_812/g.1815 Transcript_812/m.1815 type:complete len:547 (-) Transcript_812:220-1860(-)
MKGSLKGTFCTFCLVLASALCLAHSVAVKKACIIGCGSGGLGLAASLKQLQSGVEEVYVYEARDNFLQAKLGGGIQLSGGAVILEKLGCLDALEKTAQPLASVLTRDRGGKKLLSLDLRSLAKRLAKNTLCARGGAGEPLLYAIMRDSLISILYEATQKLNPTRERSGNGGSGGSSGISQVAGVDTKVTVVAGKRLVSLKEEGGKVTVTFGDGTSEGGFDLVVGGDGVGSAVRQYTAFPNQPIGVIGGIGEKGGLGDPDQYTGIRISYCVTPPMGPAALPDTTDTADQKFQTQSSWVNKKPDLTDGVLLQAPGSEFSPADRALLSSLRAKDRSSFHQWFGDSVYVLAASYGGSQGPQHMLAVVYKDDQDALYGQNPDWKVSENAKDLVLKRLKMAGFGENGDLLDVLKAASLPGGRFFDLGVKDSPIPLKSWSSESGRVILMGDSAHAMSPFLGQGANQALQDAYCLASLIRDANLKRTDMPTLAAKFESIRKPPTALLSLESSFLGRLETLGSPVGNFVKDNFFRLMDKSGVAGLVYIFGALPKL